MIMIDIILIIIIATIITVLMRIRITLQGINSHNVNRSG